MKTNTKTTTAPLLPLSAPVGVSGVTLVKCTTYEPFDPKCPALCKHCGGSEKSHAASPVDSVGVPAHSPLFIILDEIGCLAHGITRNHCARVIENKVVDAKSLEMSSHAANLAKIKALEEALARIAHQQTERSGRTCHGAADYWQDQCIALREIARAALALPSA